MKGSNYTKLKLILFVLISMIVCFPMTASAEDINFKLKAYTCPGLDSGTSNTTKKNAATNCIKSYLKGDLSAISDGGEVSPGANIMVVVDYKMNIVDYEEESLSLPKTFNLILSYDKQNVVPYKASNTSYKTSQYYINEANPIFNFTGTADFWTEQLNYAESEGLIATILNSSATAATDVVPFMNSDGEPATEGTLLYTFFTVKSESDGVTLGADLPFSLYKRPNSNPISTFNSVAVTYDQQPITLKVAGGSSSDPLSTDVGLESLAVTGNGYDYMTPLNFQSGDSRRTFNLVVPYSVSSVDISAITAFAQAQITGLAGAPATGSATKNNFSLNVGTNSIEFQVHAQDQTVSAETYIINIYRLNNVATLNSLSVKNGSSEVGSLSSLKYSGQVLYAVDSVNVAATLTDSKGYMTVDGTKVDGSSYSAALALNNYVYDSTDGKNTRTIKVSAENCKTEYASVHGNSCTENTYEVEIVRKRPSATKTLSSLKVDGTSVTDFSPTNYTYTYGTVTVGSKFGVPANKNNVNITATLTDSLGSIVSGTGNCSLSVGPNACEVVVAAEDPNLPTQKYTVNIYKLSDEKRINESSLTVTPYVGATSDSSLGTLTKSTTEINTWIYSYDPTVTKMDFSVSVMDIVSGTAKATAVLSDATGTETQLATSNNGTITYAGILPTTNKLKVLVTAENGDTSTYIINLVRGASTDTSLKSLVVSKDGVAYTLDPQFTYPNSTRKFYLTVDPDVTEVDVTAEANSVYAKPIEITGNSGFKFEKVNENDNTINVRVTAENGTSYTDYEIIVTRKKYTISDLTGLTAKVDGVDKITYDAATRTYEFSVDYDVTSVSIGATANSDYFITITGTGDKTLNTGLNTFVVHTQSQETGATGTSKDYTIKVNRAYNTDPSVSSVVVSTSKGNINGSCDNTTHICTLEGEVPNDFASATNSNVTFNFPATPLSTDASRATASVITTTINTTDNSGNTITNEVPVVVKSEADTVNNSTGTTYTLQIVKAKSTNNILNTVTVTPSPTGNTKNCSLGSSVSCSIDVPVTTTGFIMAGTLPDGKAAVSFATKDGSQTGPDFTMASNQSEMIIVATVTPESGTPTKTYEITVSREKSSNNNLEFIKTDASGSMELIASPFNPVTQTYTVEVYGSTTSINIFAKAEDEKSTVTVSGATDTDSDKDTITVTKSLSYGNSINTANPNNTVVISVTAENQGTPKNYTVNVIRKHNTDGTLKELNVDGTSVNGFAAGDGTKTYTLDTVNYDVTELEINAKTTDELAKIVSLTVNGESVSISPYKELTKKVNLKTGANTIVITVKAHDEASANTKTYTLNVNRNYNTDKEIKTFDVKWNNVNHSVTCDSNKVCTLDDDLEVPYSFGTADSSNVILTFNNPALNESERASYTVTSTTLLTTNDDLEQVENEVPVTVFSEADRVNNAEGTVYTLKLKRTRSSSKKLRQVNTFINGATTNPKTCNFTSSSCTIDVPTGTTEVRLEALLDDTIKSRASFTTGTGSDLVVGPSFDFPLVDSEGNANSTLVVNVTVTAEDGTTADYTLTINRALSSDNKISQLVVKDSNGNELALNPTFDYVNNPTQQVFSLTVDDEINSVDIYAKAHDDRATLLLKDASLTDTNSSISIIETTKNLVHDVNNQVVIQSKSQNNDSINYTINITRKRGVNPYLNTLTYDHSELFGTESLTGLDTNNYTHTMDSVLYNTTSFDLTATLADERAAIDSIKVNGVMITVNSSEYDGVTTYTATPILKTGTNTIVISTKAHNTSVTNTYTLSVTRGLNSNKNISSIEITTSEGKKEAECSDDVDDQGRTICYLKDSTSDSVVVPHNMTIADSSNIKVNLPNGLLANDPKASATITSTSLETTDNTGATIINKVPVTVTAEDNTTKEYVVYVERTRNDVKTLTRVDAYVGKDGNAINELNIENYCVFDGANTTCNISVPQATTSFKLVGTLGDSEKSSVSFKIGETVSDTFEMLSVDSDSSKTVIATVTAEDGTTATYTINVNRQASNNSFLASLKTNAKQSIPDNYVSVPSFRDSTTHYTVEVEGIQDTIKVQAIAADERSKVTIEGETYEPGTVTDRITYTKTLNNPGEDTEIVVVVQPEDGSTARNYTITVKRKSSVDPYLSMIYINGKSIDEYMDGTFEGKNKFEYVLNELPYNTYNIAITADNYDTTYGKVTVNGAPEGTGVSVDLQTKYYGHTYPVNAEDEYVNVITVTGIAHDESVTKDYTIKVKRTPNDNFAVSKVEVLYNGEYHEATCDMLNYRCTITVPNSVATLDNTNVRVTPYDGNLDTDAKATITMGSTELSTTSTTEHKFTSTSESGTQSKEYKLIVTREKSNNAKLNSILVYDITGTNVIGSFNPSFDASKPEAQQVYTVSVPDGTSAFRVYAEPVDENATVTGATKDLTKTNGDYMMVESTKTVQVVSRSQDNSTSITYTLNFTRQKNADYKLGTISIKDQNNNEYNLDITPDISGGIPENTTEFNLTVPNTASELLFEITPNNSLASISYGTGADIATPSNTSTNQATYAVSPNTTYRMKVIVTSEAGADQPYYINVTVEPKDDNTLKSLTYRYGAESATELLVEGATSPFDLGTVPYSTSKIILDAEVNDATATITSGSDIGELSLTTADEGNTFNITVTAQNGSTKTYVVKVKREKNNVATLKSLNISGITLNETFNSNTLTYTANVPDGKNSITASDVTFSKTDPNSKVEVGELTMNSSGTYEYKVKVIAENGVDYNEYVITLTKPKSRNDYLKAVELSAGSLAPTFDKNSSSYTLNVPQNVSSITITGVPEDATAIVSGNGSVTVVDGETITLTVQAEVGSAVQLPRSYTFTFKIIKSNVNTLDDLTISGHIFKEGNGKFSKTSSNTTYTVSDNLDSSVSKVKVNATPTNTDSVIKYYKDSISDSNIVCQGAGVYSCDVDLIPTIGNGSIFVQVTAPDGIAKKTYTINYTKVKSSNNFLSNIEPSVGDLNREFSSAILIYTMDLASSVNSLNLEFTADDSNSSIRYVEGNEEALSSLTVSLNDISPGRTTVTVEVTAEDQGTPKRYIVYIDKANESGSSDATLDSITVTANAINYPLTPAVNSSDTSYTIGTVPFGIIQFEVNAVAHDSNATVKYAGPGESYHESNIVSVPIENGTKAISIQVRAEDGTYKDYSITYTKQADTNNYLSGLTVMNMTLDNAFDKDRGSYKVLEHLTTDESTIVISATKESESSIITIGGQEYVSGTNKTIQNLGYGKNTISILVTSEGGSSRTYIIEVYRDSDQEIITSENYGHTIEDGYIKTIGTEKKVTEIKDQLDNENYKLEIWKADNSAKLDDDATVGTGMIVKLFIDGEMVDSKIVVIMGDTTGDGKVNMNDVSRIINHYLKRNYLVDAPLVAADVTKDSKTNMNDVSRVINHYLKRAYIEYK